MNIKALSISSVIVTLVGCTSNLGVVDNKTLQTYKQDPSKYAIELVSNMTDREKIGQTIMMDFRSWGTDKYTDEPVAVTQLNDDIAGIIKDYHLGGVILFRQNLVNTPQTVDLVNAMQAARSNLPLLIATDQEGGYVTRLQEGTEMPGNMALAATGDTKNAYYAGSVHGEELSALGINYNFGPVVDVNVNQSNPIIGVRSYSSDLATIDNMANSYMKGIQQHGVITSLKHFPGHGNVSVDSHYDLPIVDYSRSEWEQVDLTPFKKAIENGADSIMTAHVVVPSVDSRKLKATLTGKEIGIPATFSDKILTGVLRDEIGFDGLIVTDALDMAAIADNFDRPFAVKQSISAGADIALMPLQITSVSEIKKVEDLYQQLEQEMEVSTKFNQRITESAVRVVKTKLEMGLINTKHDALDAMSIVASNENKATEAHIADQAITLIKNDGTLPISPKSLTNILIVSDESSRNELIANALKSVSDQTGNNPMFISQMNFPLAGNSINEPLMQQQIQAADLVILATYNLTDRAPNAQKLLDYTAQEKVTTVVISTRNPYDIAHLDNVQSNIAIYGITGFDITNADRNSLEANIKAGIRSIFLNNNTNKPLNNPQGKLPVDIKNKSGSILYSIGHGLSYDI
jgi:beta-N-acetylhexosaminidase